ncbi:glycerol acyltransferase [Aggregicoccus sp. 17bor-14]|uniref:lysophospholipid acyltransferase family protein n=1 Tax=Myxococcaceae TaxID=31 RepID=UPI00129D14C3|nr:MULTISPECIES: lysophospholipid acyltransferase family protein [Myxococcaceae]MBF5042422.1 lysophospholipid acyltransferase family protein [Simulacricoccus sp. 17bor-14]MRI88194.1 glycerol acyltransferase [Aggregicoccus sp. 17bor-14]
MARLAKWMLRAGGWRLLGQPPALDKYLVVFYPHTSNWDFVLGILAGWGLGLDVTFLGKHTLFQGPLGPLMRALGGHPVRREERSNMVEQVAQLVRSRERIVLALAPEGTRKRAEAWKSGFYYIAREAHLPVVPAFLDARTRTVGLGPPLYLTGDVQADMAVLRDFYADKQALRPEGAGPVVLR